MEKVPEVDPPKKKNKFELSSDHLWTLSTPISVFLILINLQDLLHRSIDTLPVEQRAIATVMSYKLNEVREHLNIGNNEILQEKLDGINTENQKKLLLVLTSKFYDQSTNKLYKLDDDHVTAILNYAKSNGYNSKIMDQIACEDIKNTLNLPDIQNRVNSYRKLRENKNDSWIT
jgi:DNA polymerase III alpha subunit (gram-positive type)